VITSK